MPGYLRRCPRAFATDSSIAALCCSLASCSGAARGGGQASPAKPASNVWVASSAAPTPQAPAPQLGPKPTLAVSDVSLGADHVCALASNGTVWCWGANYAHQVMAGSVDSYSTPVRIALPLPATDVVASGGESCALLNDGRRACWGGGPEIEFGFEIESAPRFQRLVPARPTNCGVTRGQELVCGGFNHFGVLGFPWENLGQFEAELPHRAVPLPGRVEQAAVAGDLGCAVAGAEQKLWCWGNGWGCNGPKPVTLPTPAKVSALTAGGARVCLLTADGDVYQFTDLPVPESSLPPTCFDAEAVRPLAKIAEGATQVSCFADQFSGCSMCSGCIVDRQQRVLCWNDPGRYRVVTLDDNMSYPAHAEAEPPKSLVVPTLVKGLTHTKRIAAGNGFYCSVTESGLLRCWGRNSYGQLGRGNTSDEEAAPAEPAWPL